MRGEEVGRGTQLPEAPKGPVQLGILSPAESKQEEYKEDWRRPDPISSLREPEGDSS